MPGWLSDCIDWLAVYLAVLWIACLTGCSSTGPVTRADVRADTLCWSANIAYGRSAWLAEARKRFDRPFVFVCHGNSEGKDWLAAPDRKFVNADLEAVGWMLHGLMPDRDVVLVSCNGRALRPRLPRRVWYATSDVWSEPDGACFFDPPDGVTSSIWSFIEGTERE